MIVFWLLLIRDIYAIFASSLVTSSVDKDSEFWNREDEASLSGEDISDSDGKLFFLLVSIIICIFLARRPDLLPY